MEIMTFVGRKHVDFTDDSGKTIKGWSLFYTMPDERTEGLMCGKLFVADTKVEALGLVIPEPGMVCEVFYDRYGRPQAIKPVK